MKTCGAGGFVFLGEVDDQHAQRLADLDRGQADAGRVIHRLEHVVGELSQRRIDALDGLGDHAQDGIRQDDERLDRHRPHLRCPVKRVNRAA